ncbi:hypothetical protein AeMF1_001852 [Aphanomyces euteiches]|nr:hypothetical protein AeMF1_001852 [Aphanomyces euteiches]KAH9189675.1 hypothetical protein AeNC1_008346 [Aphanomyces euteiches]
MMTAMNNHSNRERHDLVPEMCGSRSSDHILISSRMNDTLRDSDLVSRFLALEERNETLDVEEMDAPPRVESRLEPYNLSWEDLSPLARQALAWDMGLVVTQLQGGTWIWHQVYVKTEGTTMAQIAWPFTRFDDISIDTIALPSTQTCRGPSRSYRVLLNKTKNATIDNLTKCVVKVLPNAVAVSTAVIAAEDALKPEQVPEPRLFCHVGRDSTSGTIMAIHTWSTEGTLDACPPRGEPSGLIVPCDSNEQVAFYPRESQVMDKWLGRISSDKVTKTTTLPPGNSTDMPLTSNTTEPPANTTQSHSNAEESAITFPPSPSPTRSETIAADPASRSKAWIAGTAGGAVVLVALMLVSFCLYRRNRRSRQSVAVFEPYEEQPIQTPRAPFTLPLEKRFSKPALDCTTMPNRPLLSRSTAMEQQSLDPMYVESVLVNVRRLEFELLDFSDTIEINSSMAIYAGSYQRQPVAIKLLHLSSFHPFEQDKINRFADEICLVASFEHPNIITLVGYTWHSNVRSLVAVTELLPQGNLTLLLHEHPSLDWGRKAPLALDIARALQYLHVILHPMVIHGDLRSRNVLLNWPHAKLSGFSVSRQVYDDEMVHACVGSGCYTAPEVLRGGQYSELADMYSFGCILVEIDTHRPIYSDLRHSHIHLMQLILHDAIAPTVSPTCPPVIRQLVDQCLQRDPLNRPSAFDAARVLDAFVNARPFK